MARAMTDEAKKIKSDLILNNAFKLFETNTFKSFKMDELAKMSSMSKGILFKYFRSKEMLFLSMLDKEYMTMLDEYNKLFSVYDKITPSVLKEVFTILTRTILLPNTPLMRLNMIKGSILEQNIDYEFAKEHKLRFFESTQVTFGSIMNKLDGLTPEEFMNMFHIHGALLFGYMHSVTESKVIKQVLHDHNLMQFEIDPTEKTIESLNIVLDSYFKMN